MKIFITGATGYIGQAIAGAARDAGHTVLALARTEQAMDSIRARGWIPAVGSLDDTDLLVRWARKADAVVHAALVAGPGGPASDWTAALALAEAVRGSGVPFVYTSGAWVLGDTGSGTAHESSPANPPELVKWRVKVERHLLALAGTDTRIVVVRPGIVYDEWFEGGIPGLMARGRVPLVGPGEQKWALVHRDDLAQLYLAALDRAPSRAILHGVSHTRTAGDVWRSGRTRASRIATLAAARSELGAFADALALDQSISAARTGALTAWRPRRPAPTPAPARAAAAAGR